MEKIETDFSAAYKIAWTYLDSLEGDKSSCLSLDLERRSLINEDTETAKVQGDRSVDHVTANHCPEAMLYKLKKQCKHRETESKS